MIAVDAHSKWPEVIGLMKTTTAGSTINALSYVIGRYGLPEQVLSDNGPPFQSVEYEDVLRQNEYRKCWCLHTSNGQAERFVQTFKNYVSHVYSSGSRVSY